MVSTFCYDSSYYGNSIYKSMDCLFNRRKCLPQFENPVCKFSRILAEGRHSRENKPSSTRLIKPKFLFHSPTDAAPQFLLETRNPYVTTVFVSASKSRFYLFIYLLCLMLHYCLRPCLLGQRVTLLEELPSLHVNGA